MSYSILVLYRTSFGLAEKSLAISPHPSAAAAGTYVRYHEGKSPTGFFKGESGFQLLDRGFAAALLSTPGT